MGSVFLGRPIGKKEQIAGFVLLGLSAGFSIWAMATERELTQPLASLG